MTSEKTQNDEMLISVDGKILRRGYTTGTCAAAAAKAAAEMLLSGKTVESAEILTPKGILLDLDIEEISVGNDYAECAVRKNGGDDIDATHGHLIFTRVEKREEGIVLKGGKGVGTVTKRGLDQPVGNAAINRIPRVMISEALEDTAEKYGYGGGFEVTVSVPDGEEIAEKTFNPRLGIVGGISILGTSGIVEPMSKAALIDTIKAEMNVRRAEGTEYLLMVPGNYGAGYAETIKGIDAASAVRCSNYIGESLDCACEAGFKGVLLVGNLGKLVKLAGGIMNTHSRESDGRMEIIAANAALAGASIESVRKVMGCTSTDGALNILERENVITDTLAYLTEKMEYHMNRRTMGKLLCGVMVFSSEYGFIGRSGSVSALLKHMGGKI